jgi:hypothetical protein
MIVVSLISSNVAIWDSPFTRCRVGLGLNSVCQYFSCVIFLVAGYFHKEFNDFPYR